jgi:hypothetical protein
LKIAAELFDLAHCFDTTRADFLFFAVNLFGLQIYLEFPFGCDVGMGSGVSGLGFLSANIATCHGFISIIILPYCLILGIAGD